MRQKHKEHQQRESTKTPRVKHC